MGFVSDLFGMVNVQRIKNGGTARISVCQITSLIVNMSEAKQNLPSHNFADVYDLFQRLRKVKKKKRMDIYGYYDLSAKIILLYNRLAPYILYSGNSPEDAAALLESIEAEYGDLRIADIEAEVFGVKSSRPRIWLTVLVVLSVLLLCTSLFFCYKYLEAKDKCTNLQKSLSDSNETISHLSDQYMDLAQEVSFFESSVVLTTAHGSKYHMYSCRHIDLTTAKVLTFEQAKAAGYSACATCKPSSKGRLIKIP